MTFDREDTINWLVSNQSNGAFEGYPEEDMDFNTLSDEDLEWYFNEWVLPDRAN